MAALEHFSSLSSSSRAARHRHGLYGCPGTLLGPRLVQAPGMQSMEVGALSASVILPDPSSSHWVYHMVTDLLSVVVWNLTLKVSRAG